MKIVFNSDVFMQVDFGEDCGQVHGLLDDCSVIGNLEIPNSKKDEIYGLAYCRLAKISEYNDSVY